MAKRLRNAKPFSLVLALAALLGGAALAGCEQEGVEQIDEPVAAPEQQ